MVAVETTQRPLVRGKLPGGAVQARANRRLGAARATQVDPARDIERGVCPDPCSRSCGRRRAPILGAIELVPITSHRSAEARLWKEMISTYHYCGYQPLVGAQIRYL